MEREKEATGIIDGLYTGHAVGASGLTGVSVFVFPQGASAAADMRGFATGTRQVDSLSLTHTVEKIFALTLSGGSVFGFESGSAATRILETREMGIYDGKHYLPIVPTAVIYDLSLGDGSSEGYAELGERAANRALDGNSSMGFPGAAAGASVGKIEGIGMATKTTLGESCRVLKDGIALRAAIILNAFGDIYDREGRIIAGNRCKVGTGFRPAMELFREGYVRKPFGGAENTTITVIITDCTMGKKELSLVSSMLGNFLGGHIRPYGSIYDGDIVFAISTGKRGKLENLMEFVAVAEIAVYDALLSAVFSANPGGGLPCGKDIIEKGEDIGGD